MAATRVMSAQTFDLHRDLRTPPPPTSPPAQVLRIVKLAG